MATVSSGSMMAIVPQKKAFDVNIVYPLQQFIKQTMTSNLDDYYKSVESLNQLRTEALFKSNRQEKLNKLMRYYDQLTAIEAKLPISENQIRIGFKWQDAFDRGGLFGRSTLTLSSNLYERLCVLFNIAAVCSEIAGTQPLDTEEGLKIAAKLYQQAAGAFAFIRDNSLTATRNDCTFDLYPETLSLLSTIMLAHAQEVFYHKSIKDKMRDLIVCKLAAQASDYYADAMKLIQSNEQLRDLQKYWLNLLAGKQALFHAMSEYHRGEHDKNEKKFGESIARMTKALELLKTADQRGGKELSCKSQMTIVTNEYEKTKKDNDYVYYERVPEYKTLPPIERAAIAKSTLVKFPISEEFKDLFSTMVPVAVHNGLQTFKSKKMDTFNLEIGKLRQATELLNTALTTWNLPASIEDVSGMNKIPQSLLDKSQHIKDKGGITKVDSMMTDLPSLLQRNTEILQESKRVLDEEERSDTELRTQMREKWTRTPSRQLTEYLHAEIKQYENIMENAIKANRVIEGKYRQHRDGIQLLSKSSSEISGSLPAASPVAALQNHHVVKDLRRLMDQVEGLRACREVLESEMKNIESTSDAVTARLVSALQNSQGIGEHAIIQDELENLVSPMRKQVKENIQEQEKLLGYIEKAVAEFNKERVHNETSKIREEMLKNLSSASDSFTELYNHLEEGIKFYNDLTPILLKFQNKVNDFVFARKTEKDDLMKEIQTNLTRPSSGASMSSGSAKPSRPPPPVPSGNDSANNPYTNPYFPAAPMPNVYNPYMYPGSNNGGAGGGGGQPGYPSYPQQPYYPPYPPQ